MSLRQLQGCNNKSSKTRLIFCAQQYKQDCRSPRSRRSHFYTAVLRTRNTLPMSALALSVTFTFLRGLCFPSCGGSSCSAVDGEPLTFRKVSAQLLMQPSHLRNPAQGCIFPCRQCNRKCKTAARLLLLAMYTFKSPLLYSKHGMAIF